MKQRIGEWVGLPLTNASFCDWRAGMALQRTAQRFGLAGRIAHRLRVHARWGHWDIRSKGKIGYRTDGRTYRDVLVIYELNVTMFSRNNRFGCRCGSLSFFRVRVRRGEGFFGWKIMPVSGMSFSA